MELRNREKWSKSIHSLPLLPCPLRPLHRQDLATQTPCVSGHNLHVCMYSASPSMCRGGRDCSSDGNGKGDTSTGMHSRRIPCRRSCRSNWGWWRIACPAPSISARPQAACVGEAHVCSTNPEDVVEDAGREERTGVVHITTLIQPSSHVTCEGGRSPHASLASARRTCPAEFYRAAFGRGHRPADRVRGGGGASTSHP